MRRLAFLVLALAVFGAVGVAQAAPSAPTPWPSGLPAAMLVYPTPTPTPAPACDAFRIESASRGAPDPRISIVLEWEGLDCILQAERRGETDPLQFCFERAERMMLRWGVFAGVALVPDLAPAELPKPLHHTPTKLAETIRQAVLRGDGDALQALPGVAQVRLYGGRLWGESKLVVAVKTASGKVFEVVFRDGRFTTNFWVDGQGGNAWNYVYYTCVRRDRLSIVSLKQAAKLLGGGR